MPSEIIERMKSVTTIEQIDAEVEILSTQQREIENEKAALLDLRKVLVVARDGKPAKALGERVRAYLKYFGEATVAETSRALRVPYGTVYSHLKKSNDVEKTGEYYSLRIE